VEQARSRAVVVLADGVRPAWRTSLGAVLAALETRSELEASGRTVDRTDRLEDVLLAESQKQAMRLVVCLGPGCDEAVFTVAPVEPGVRFVAVPGAHGERNVVGVSFAENEAAYVAGAVAGAMGGGRPVVLVDGPGCSGEIRDALEHGLRSRARRASVEAVHRAAALAGNGWEAGAAMAVLCPGPGNRELVRTLVGTETLVVAFDPATVEGTDGLRCAVIEEDLPEALVRVAVDVLERDVTGKAYLFDLGSGVVRFRFCEGTAERLNPEALEAAQEARDEVTAGIAEIEVLDLHR